jgi:hypothetical protein
MTAHGDDSACTGAVVRKPPVKERAGDEVPTWSVFQPWLVADGGEDSVGAASRRASFRLERLPPQSPAIALPRRG